MCNTQSSPPEDGHDHRLEHVELIGIINKPLLLLLVGVYIIYVNDARSNKYQINNICSISSTCRNISLQLSHPHYIFSPLALTTSDNRTLFSRGQSGRRMQTNIYFHIIPKLWMRDSTHPFPYTSSWCRD